MRRSRTLTSAAIAVAALAAVSGSLASPAGATGPASASGAAAPAPTSAPATAGSAFVACPLPAPANPATDLVMLKAIGVDLGTQGLNSSNAPNCSATVRWDTSGGTIRPIISGDLILKNSLGVNAQVMATYYDVHGNSFGSLTSYPTAIGTSNDEQSFPFTIDAFEDPEVYEVSIATQILSAGSWVDLRRTSVYLSSSDQAADAVQIDAPGQDFGTLGVVGGAPVAPGTLTWDLNGDTVTARLTGDLTMTNSLGVNARMRITTFDVHGTQLTTHAGATKTPPSNAQAVFPINLSSFSDPLTYKAETSMEVEVGANNWVPVGSTVTSYL